MNECAVDPNVVVSWMSLSCSNWMLVKYGDTSFVPYVN
jgi:hypothetical protein